MILAGTVAKEDKKTLVEIAKTTIVMERSRYLGKIAKRQNEILDKAVEKILGGN